MNLAILNLVMYFMGEKNKNGTFFEYEALKHMNRETGEERIVSEFILYLDGEEIVELHPTITKQTNMNLLLIDILNQIEIQNRIDPFMKLLEEYKELSKKIQMKEERYERMPKELKEGKIGIQLKLDTLRELEMKQRKKRLEVDKRTEKHKGEKAYFLIEMNKQGLLQYESKVPANELKGRSVV